MRPYQAPQNKIDGTTTINFKLQFGVAGICLPPDPKQTDVTEVCFTPAYYKAAGIGVSIDGDGYHFGLTLNLGGVKGHGSIKVSEDQIKLTAPIPILPGVGLSVMLGSGTDDPVLNKILSSISLGVMGGPMSSLTSLLRPGSPSSLIPSTDNEELDKAIGIAADLALIGTSGPFAGFVMTGVLLKHFLSLFDFRSDDEKSTGCETILQLLRIRAEEGQSNYREDVSRMRMQGGRENAPVIAALRKQAQFAVSEDQVFRND